MNGEATLPAAVPTLAERSDHHFISLLDLRVAGLPDGRAQARVRLGHGRPVDGGLLVLMADIVAGLVALEAGRPCGISTTELHVHGIGVPRGPGELVATATLLSSTRQRACMRVEMRADGPAGGAAVAIASFRLFPGAMDVGDPGTWAVPDRGRSISGSLAEHTGITVDPVAGTAEVPVRPDLANPLGGLQGGITAALLEAAGATAVPPGQAVRDLAVTYLAQARGGPIKAEITEVHAEGTVVVHAHDLGQGRRPVAVGVIGHH